jgi:hypothetical protein
MYLKYSNLLGHASVVPICFCVNRFLFKIPARYSLAIAAMTEAINVIFWTVDYGINRIT